MLAAYASTVMVRVAIGDVMKLTNKRLNEIINLLKSKKENGQSIDLIAFNMTKRYGRRRTEIIVKRVYPNYFE